MVYLTILLTILISILIYTFDPAPNRSEHDITGAEAYVLGFINQHQAARDFMKHWLGHSKANDGAHGVVGGKGVILSGDTDPGTEQGRMESFMLKGLTSNIHTYNGSGFATGSDNGTFKSAYVCLDEHLENLVAETNCRNRYVVTYAKDKPDWWTDPKEQEKKATKGQRWRRAIAQRTHGSYGCGVLTMADGTGSKNWCYKTGKKNTIKPKESSCATGEREGKYCIDNGEGCQTLLPSGIQVFLENEINNDLSDRLVCISTVKNPYVTEGLMFQYDSIDSAGNGAPAANGTNLTTHSSPFTWANSEVGTPVNWNASGSPTWEDSSKSSPMIPHNNGHAFNFQLGNNDSTFTLTIVAKVPNKTAQTIIGPVTPSGLNIPDLTVDDGAGNKKKANIGMYYMNDCSIASEGAVTGDCFLLLTRKDASHADTIDGNIISYDNNNNGIISWTIVKRPDLDGISTLYWYNGAEPVCDSGSEVVKHPYIDGGGTRNNMTLGGGSGGSADDTVRIYAIRYYNRPLTRREINRNFRADGERYGVGSWTGSCTNKCEVDSDCLNTYQSCKSGECKIKDE
ncbi:MAG: hypothetical protein J6Y85_01020 [Alphaproteobacteria bacterium]|nr:hypothetical protein [Alphaproteobacteria bacterium]